MEMLNRAIEGATDYREFQRGLTEPMRNLIAAEAPPAKVPAVVAHAPQKRKGENRQQYRARVHGGA